MTCVSICRLIQNAKQAFTLLGTRCGAGVSGWAHIVNIFRGILTYKKITGVNFQESKGVFAAQAFSIEEKSKGLVCPYIYI